MVVPSAFGRLLLQATAQLLIRILPVVARPIMRPFTIEALTRLAVRESSQFVTQLSNAARQKQFLLPTAKQSSGIWTKQAVAISDMNAAIARSRVRTRLIVAATLTQFLVAWKWPWEEPTIFDECGDDTEPGELEWPFDEPLTFEGRGHDSERRVWDWIERFGVARRYEGQLAGGLSFERITVPLMPCRWRHCCECEHLGSVWCTKRHAK